jgi:hypothetical protein
MMAMTVTKPARAIRKTTASPVQSDRSLDPLGGDPRCVVQAKVAIESRKKAVRKRYVDPTICEGEFAVAEQEFMQAMQEYKKWSGRMFPTWSEVLEVLQDLGYAKPLSEVAGKGNSFTNGKNPHLGSEQSRRGVNQPAA